MLRRLLAPMFLVFPLVMVVGYFFLKFSEPEVIPPSVEAVRAQELAKVKALLQQWEKMPAEARQAAASQLVSGLNFPMEDLLWETTWTLGELGPAAVPALSQTLQDPQAPAHARQHAVWALGLVGPDAKQALPLVKKALADPMPEVRATAAFALSQIDPDAAHAVPTLIPLFADSTPDVTEAAAQAVARYREQAVPLLRKALTDPSPPIRKHAVITLGLMGAHGGNAVGDLVAIVRDPDNELRAEAAEALGNIGAPAMASLAAALKDQSDTVRLQAADALGRIGRAAIPTLVLALKDDSVNVRLQALNSLAPFADDVIDPVAEASKDQATAVRELAVQVLGIVQREGSQKRVAPPLLAALADPEASVRKHAMLGLRRLQPPAEVVLPAVTLITRDANPAIRYDALAYLYSGGFGNRAVPFLALALKDPDEKVQKLAIFILEEMKSDPALLYDRVAPILDEQDETARINALNVIWRAGPAAVPHMLNALKAPEPRVRKMAIWALHQGSVDSSKVFSDLLTVLKDPDAGVRGSGMAALARHGAPAVPHLAEGLQDDDPAVRIQAATSLGYVAAKPADVLPLLGKAMKDPNAEVRVAAAAALEQVGVPAVPVLLLAFQDKSDQVWKQALKSLIKMPADNRVLLPVLTAALRHEDPHIRAGAAYAMERFKEEAVPPLIAVLKSDSDHSVHWAVVDVIDTIGIPARSAFPDLIEPARNHPAEKVRYGALVAMLKMQGLGRYRESLTLEKYKENLGIVIPHLIRGLDDRDAQWRWQSAVILGVIGPPAKDAVPALTRALEDREPRVREAAREALQRISKE